MTSQPVQRFMQRIFFLTEAKTGKMFDATALIKGTYGDSRNSIFNPFKIL